jgi:membrane-bound lytic murein transglycosylase D
VSRKKMHRQPKLKLKGFHLLNLSLCIVVGFISAQHLYAGVHPSQRQKPVKQTKSLGLKISSGQKYRAYTPVNHRPSFDIPVTYNKAVGRWIRYFQTSGSKWFKKRLERSFRYLPLMKMTLKKRGLPQDLAYLSMIESGFSPHAVSSAEAVGYWQFIRPTGERYGLNIDWWVDERKDVAKSTYAASRYLADLYKIFGSWYLTASGYNMGETRLKRLIRKHGTRDFWVLSSKSDFPKETRDYIPKLIAAVLISKAPQLYGFRDIKPWSPKNFEYFAAPGGTDLVSMANELGIKKSWLLYLNPSLKHGFIPKQVDQYKIRIPRGYAARVSNFVRKTVL